MRVAAGRDRRLLGHNDSGQATVPGGTFTHWPPAALTRAACAPTGLPPVGGTTPSGSRRRRAGRSPPSPRVALIRAGCAPTATAACWGCATAPGESTPPAGTFTQLTASQRHLHVRVAHLTGPPPAGAYDLARGSRRRRAGTFDPAHRGPLSRLRLAPRRDRRVLGIRTVDAAWVQAFGNSHNSRAAPNGRLRGTTAAALDAHMRTRACRTSCLYAFVTNASLCPGLPPCDPSEAH